MSNMFSHFSFPWLWSDCEDSAQCGKVAHVPFDAENANKYPREWVEAAADGWVINDEEQTISMFDEKVSFTVRTVQL